MPSPIRLPSKVAPGQAVSASAFNQLIDAIDAAFVEPGDGLVAQTASGRRVLALAGGLLSRCVEAIITAVHGTDGAMVEDVTYDAAAIGKSGAVLVGATPRYGRTYVAGVACVPAQVGDTCLIVRGIEDGELTADLWVFSEQYMVSRCGTPARPTPGMTTPRPFELPPTPNASSRGTEVSAPDGGDIGG